MKKAAWKWASSSARRSDLGVEQGLEPDSTAVIMELELTPHSKAGIRTEQDNTSAGVQWKMNY